MPKMRKTKEGRYQWVASDWWKRLQSQKEGRRFHAVVVKLATSHAVHAEGARQFIENLVTFGDHAQAWEGCNPPVRHRVSIRALAVQDAKKAVNGTITMHRKRAERHLDRVRQIIATCPPEEAVERITALIGTAEDDPGKEA